MKCQYCRRRAVGNESNCYGCGAPIEGWAYGNQVRLALMYLSFGIMTQDDVRKELGWEAEEEEAKR